MTQREVKFKEYDAAFNKMMFKLENKYSPIASVDIIHVLIQYIDKYLEKWRK